MRVYYHGIHENNGGLENFAKNLIESVLKKDSTIKYTFLAEKENFSYRKYFEELGCEVIILPHSRKHPLKFYKKLRNVLYNVDRNDSIVQLNICSYRNYFLFKACKKAKLKTIIVGHYSKIKGKLGFLHYINKLIFAKFGLKVTISEDVTNFMFKDKEHVFYIDNGISSDKFSFSNEYRSEIRKQLNVSDDCFVIGQVGRISSEKNQEFSIQAFNALKDKTNLDAKLVFVGKQSETKVLDVASKSKYKNDILFLGSIDTDVYKYYSAFDCCLMPSRHEGMPLSLLECCANGVPTLLSNSVPKLNFECSKLKYLSLETDKWVSSLEDLSKNKYLKRKNYLANTEYDIDVCSNKYINLYHNFDKVLNCINSGE